MPGTDAVGRGCARPSPSPGCVQAPGVLRRGDRRAARRARASAALHLSGAVTSAVALGLPDLGYLHGTDVADLARRVTAVTDVPLIADADTGYGNALHARRTVEQYARIGRRRPAPRGPGQPEALRPHGGQGGRRPRRGRAEGARRRRGRHRPGRHRAHRRDVGARSRRGDRAGRRVRRGGCRPGLRRGRHRRRVGSRAVHEAVPDARLVVNVSEADPRLRPLPLDVLASFGVQIALYPVAPLLAAAACGAGDVRRDRRRRAARTSVERLAWDELTGLLGQPELLEPRGSATATVRVNASSATIVRENPTHPDEIVGAVGESTPVGRRRGGASRRRRAEALGRAHRSPSGARACAPLPTPSTPESST